MPTQQKSNAPTRMAEAATAVRAAHTLHEQSIIFEDPCAIHLTSPGWRTIIKNRWLFHFAARRLFKVLRPAHGQVLARSRYTEDKLAAAISGGMVQYVILGAGFDSFALRQQNLVAEPNIFELDHQVTQQLKKERLASLGFTLPDNLTHLPIDFAQQTISQVLKASSFDFMKSAFFSWLGTVPYLTETAIFSTLSDLAQSQASGSELIFDYASTEVAPEDLPAVKRLVKFAERRGEPLLTQFEPSELTAKLNQLGFDVLENFSQANWQLHYYDNPQTSDLRPLSAAYIVHLRIR